MTKKLIITDESAANLKQTFKGIFAVVKVPLTAMTTLAKTGARAFGVLVDVLRPVGAVLLKVAGNMGSFVSEMQTPCWEAERSARNWKPSRRAPRSCWTR